MQELIGAIVFMHVRRKYASTQQQPRSLPSLSAFALWINIALSTVFCNGLLAPGRATVWVSSGMISGTSSRVGTAATMMPILCHRRKRPGSLYWLWPAERTGFSAGPVQRKVSVIHAACRTISSRPLASPTLQQYAGYEIWGADHISERLVPASPQLDHELPTSATLTWPRLDDYAIFIAFAEIRLDDFGLPDVSENHFYIRYGRNPALTEPVCIFRTGLVTAAVGFLVMLPWRPLLPVSPGQGPSRDPASSGIEQFQFFSPCD